MPEELTSLVDLLYESYEFLVNNPYGRMAVFSAANFFHSYYSSKKDMGLFRHKHRLEKNQEMDDKSRLGKIFSWQNIFIYPLITGCAERTLEFLTLNSDNHYGPFIPLTLVSRALGSYFALK